MFVKKENYIGFVCTVGPIYYGLPIYQYIVIVLPFAYSQKRYQRFWYQYVTTIVIVRVLPFASKPGDSTTQYHTAPLLHELPY